MALDAANRDIKVVRGDSWTGFAVTWKDEDGDPQDIVEATMQIRLSPDSEVPILELTEGDGLDVTDGRVTPQLQPDETTLLMPGYYDLVAVNAGGTERTLIYGDVHVRERITRDAL